MKAHQKPIGKTQEWYTPKWIIEPLGEFDLDPCTSMTRPFDIAKRNIWINGLTINDGEWVGRVWLNPPFKRGERSVWMKRMAEHNNGIMLVPANMETKDFQKYVWGKCSGVLILKKRPHFLYPDGGRAKMNSGCTICLVAYGKINYEILKNSGLGIMLKEYTRSDTVDKMRELLERISKALYFKNAVLAWARLDSDFDLQKFQKEVKDLLNKHNQ
ncbi:adenine methyltransferase [Candidatus Pacearchaeota archaeon]|nr:adenine methyltransferase [Candidatus Pacearchaeota archaeon]